MRLIDLSYHAANLTIIMQERKTMVYDFKNLFTFEKKNQINRKNMTNFFFFHSIHY